MKHEALIFKETPTGKFRESETPCHLCGQPIQGRGAEVIERSIGYDHPMFYGGAGTQVYEIRRHFIGHK